MQTLHINVDENKIDILLNIIKNLKEDVVESYTISSDIVDAFYDERKARLTKLRNDIKSGQEPLCEFEASADGLLKELNA